jgi:hypothetical protein
MPSAPILHGESTIAIPQASIHTRTATCQFNPRPGFNETTAIPDGFQVPAISKVGSSVSPIPRSGMTAKATSSSVQPQPHHTESQWSPWSSETTLKQSDKPILNWRPIRRDEEAASRQLYTSGQDTLASNRIQYYQSEQISPRTNPASISSPVIQFQGVMPFDKDVFGHSTQNLPITNTWPEFDWPMIENLNMQKYTPTPLSEPLANKLSPMIPTWVAPCPTYPTIPVQQYRSVYPPLAPPKEVNPTQKHRGQFTLQSPVLKPISEQYLQIKPLEYTLEVSAAIPKIMPNAAPVLVAMSNNNTSIVSRSQSDVPLSQIRNRTPIGQPPSNSAQHASHQYDTQNADLSRRPSLYSIPPWRYASPAPNLVPRPQIVQSQSKNGIATTPKNISMGVDIQSRQASALNASDTTAAVAMQQTDILATNSTGFQIPDPQLRGKHSPNLYSLLLPFHSLLFNFVYRQIH